MKLRTRKTYLRNASEGSAPAAPKAKLTQRLYQLLLLFIALYLLHMLYEYLCYVRVPGQVMIEKTVISSARGGEVSELAVAEGELIKADQLIARIAPLKLCEDQARENTLQERVRYQIELAEARSHRLQSQLQSLTDNASSLVLRRALEINRLNEFEQLQWEREQARLEAELWESDDELALLRRRLESLEKDPLPLVDSDCVEEQLRAPFDSRVVVLATLEHEVASRDEAIVVLEPVNQSAYIAAYFEFSHLKEITELERARVKFADGAREEALVEKWEAGARHQLPQLGEEQPPTAGIRVMLRPLSAEAAERWRQYDRMEVEVTIVR